MRIIATYDREVKIIIMILVFIMVKYYYHAYRTGGR